jgi:hypothetical protein
MLLDLIDVIYTVYYHRYAVYSYNRIRGLLHSIQFKLHYGALSHWAFNRLYGDASMLVKPCVRAHIAVWLWFIFCALLLGIVKHYIQSFREVMFQENIVCNFVTIVLVKRQSPVFRMENQYSQKNGLLSDMQLLGSCQNCNLCSMEKGQV